MSIWSYLSYRIASNSPLLVAALAIVGLSLSIGILLVPAAGDDLAARASVSTAIATVFALFAAIVAVSAGVWVTSSDYRAREAVKTDTARLRVALKIILYKSAVLSQKSPSTINPASDTFKAEREFLSEFALSTTSFAYMSWALAVTEDAKAGTPDQRRILFLAIASLVEACEPPVDRAGVATWAVQVDSILASMEAGDLKRITDSVNFAETLAGEDRTKIARTVESAVGSSDALLGAMGNVYGREQHEGETAEATEAKFRHLQNKGVNDPNVDMFVAVFANDTEALKAALESGADTSIGDAQVLAGYKAELADFNFDERTSAE